MKNNVPSTVYSTNCLLFKHQQSQLDVDSYGVFISHTSQKLAVAMSLKQSMEDAIDHKKFVTYNLKSNGSLVVHGYHKPDYVAN